VRAEHRRIKLDAGNRLSDKPAVPTRRQSSFVAATGEEELTQHPSRQSQTIRERRLYEGEASVPAIASPDSFYFNAIS
jgi:hypothetical protein